MILNNPVRGTIHPLSWKRPAGNHDPALFQDFGPATNNVEPEVIWPGGEGIPPGDYKHFHKGIDIATAGLGVELIAMSGGLVFISETVHGGFADGENILVVHVSGPPDDATIWGYGHMASRAVSVGHRITPAEKVGVMGSTGLSTGIHVHAFLKIHVDLRRSVYDNANGRLLDVWRRLAQNVTVHPKGPGVNIRTTAGSGSTPGPLYATTQPDGTIQLPNGTSLGPTATPRKWGGTVPGALYSVGGVSGTTWDRLLLGGAYRFIAVPLAVRSA